MTAQHHDVQHEAPADEQHATPDYTDQQAPTTLSRWQRVGARAMALTGVVGMAAAAVAVMTANSWPNGGI